MTLAIYPGTFDPFHHGHMDIASRASTIFDEVVVAIYSNPGKNPLFSIDERIALTREVVAHLPNVSVATYSGLTVEYARLINAGAMVRGLRHVADFQAEHQMGWANSHMEPGVETCCLFCDREHAYLSSTILKEVASLNGKIDHMASEPVLWALRSKFLNGSPNRSTTDMPMDGTADVGSTEPQGSASQRRMVRNENQQTYTQQ